MFITPRIMTAGSTIDALAPTGGTLMFLDLCLATAAERQRPLPGDTFVPHPFWSPAYAITIAAPPARVWPWLVQMGSGRAGWYAYDHIDNGGVPSARRIVPSLQHVAVGDLMPALPGRRDCFIVLQVVPGRALVLGVPLQTPAGTSPGPAASPPVYGVGWAFVLEPLSGGRSRLLARNRVSPDWIRGQRGRPNSPSGRTLIEHIYRVLARTPRRLLVPIAGFGHYLMQARQLRGIKQRVERMVRTGDDEYSGAHGVVQPHPDS